MFQMDGEGMFISLVLSAPGSASEVPAAAVTQGTALANAAVPHLHGERVMIENSRQLLSRFPLGTTLSGGALAGLASAAVLMWRGRKDAGSAAAPLNAVSHWFSPRRALREDRASLAFTVPGTAVHMASSLLWASLFGAVRGLRRQPTVANAVADAAAVTSLAAVVDLKLVPERLTPGFERRLSDRSLVMVYGGFAIGLALAGALAARRR
jgi:hypothetical protein